MKTIFYTLASIHLFLFTVCFIGLFYIPREINLHDKYSGKQIMGIDDTFIAGDSIYVMDVKDKKPQLVLVYDIAIKDYKVGDIVK